ncbi:MAG: hypothetical protein H7A21_06370 [Spirochaetales bacterium]|nr:hypothetical protein [Leptospiraceae bacterium]MCP5481037.1 hypothetical protein [Spirochaetales bacterium]MCP5485417.1 hypothetical protein [Spirochaetales bacterium]
MTRAECYLCSTKGLFARLLSPGPAIRSVVLALMFLLAACATSPENTSGDPDNTAEAVYTEDQPRFPTPEDDAFFHEPPMPTELFRVLITEGNYEVRQLAYQDRIERVADPVGDREQMEFFQEKDNEIDFKDWLLEGTLQIRLSPLGGQTEHISYLEGQTPITWQASTYFQDDISRFRYEFPAGVVSPTRFLVRYRWVIRARQGLTAEEQRERAIEYLRAQTR